MLTSDQPTRPRCVAAVVMRDDKTLVIRRGPNVMFPGYWGPVSGRVEADESEPEAVVREVREEVGLVVRPLRAIWECPSEDGVYHLHWWLAEYVEGELVLAPDEVSDASWIDPPDFEKVDLTFEADRYFYARVFPDLAEGSPTRAREELAEGGML